MNSGYIKFHRKFTDWEWYRDNNVKILFIHLLLTANHKPSRFRGYDIQPGSVVTGRKSLAENTNLSEQQVRTALNKLKSTGEITSQATHDFSIISILNWTKYQHDNQPSNQQATSQQPASNQSATTSKECKNVKNEIKKEKQRAEKPLDVNEKVWRDFLLLRKEKKAPLTETAFNGIRRQADKAGISVEKAITISCERGWVGFKADWNWQETDSGDNRPQLEEWRPS